MSSQGGAEVSLGISSEQQQFRLMELPPEIVSLLSSPDPPIMQFKSTPTGHVALCLPNKTFQLRQVQTSNSVHILQPEQDISDGDSMIPQSRMASIAQCSSTLEFQEATSDSAMIYLKQSLPIYYGHDEATPTTTSISKHQLYSDIPLSDAEIDDDWRNLCAFEIDDGRSAFQPSAKALVQAWSAIVSASAIEKIDLSGPLEEATRQTITSSAENVPRELINAIFAHLSSQNAGRTELDKDRTVAFVGRSLILEKIEAPKADLIRQWSDLLPEAWRGTASLDTIADICTESSTGVVRLKSASSTNTTSDTKPAQSTKRKWHEKFQQSRNK